MARNIIISDGIFLSTDEDPKHRYLGNYADLRRRQVRDRWGETIAIVMLRCAARWVSSSHLQLVVDVVIDILM
eukprot:scaffold4969_cov199-Ochromonas_danica.AAC.1